MSNVQLDNPSISLATRYEIPMGSMNAEITPLLQEIDETVSSMPRRIDDFQRQVEGILVEQLSDENITKRTGVNPRDVIELQSQAKEAAAIPSDNIFLKEAKLLFKEHVGGVLEDTKSNLLHGSALSKLSTTLSFPGKALEGISIFWDKLIQKRPILKVLDSVIVKPMVIGLYTQILPVLAVVKACEFVGRSIHEVSKTGKWSSIKDVASKMAKSSIKHFERVFGKSGQVMLFGAIDTLTVDESKREVLKSIIRSHDTFLDDFSMNPKIAAAIMAGAAVSLSGGAAPEKVLKQAVTDVLSGKYKDAKVINIEELQETLSGHLRAELKKAFDNNLPNSPQSFKAVLDTITKSDEIAGNEKYKLIEAISQYAVQQAIGVDQMQSRSEPPKPQSVESAKKKRHDTAEEKWVDTTPKQKSVKIVDIKTPKSVKKKSWLAKLRTSKAARKVEGRVP